MPTYEKFSCFVYDLAYSIRRIRPTALIETICPCISFAWFVYVSAMNVRVCARRILGTGK